jgi:hypothetical protein
MVQKAVVFDLCDVCFPKETKADYVIKATINGTEYALDLCGSHWDTHNISAIIIKGRTDGPSPTGKTKPRDYCVECGKQFSIGAGMTRHMKATHKVVTNRVAV